MQGFKIVTPHCSSTGAAAFPCKAWISLPHQPAQSVNLLQRTHTHIVPCGPAHNDMMGKLHSTPPRIKKSQEQKIGTKEKLKRKPGTKPQSGPTNNYKQGPQQTTGGAHKQITSGTHEISNTHPQIQGFIKSIQLQGKRIPGCYKVCQQWQS